MKVWDAHIHFDKYSKQDRKKICESLAHHNIEGMINVSMDLASCQENLKIQNDYPSFKSAFGLHPEQSLPSEVEIMELLDWIQIHHEDMVAIGEVGLPYYLRVKENKSISYYQPYIEVLENFIKISSLLNKPIVLHAVYDDAPLVCDLLEKQNIKHAHFHWFKGDHKTMERLIRNGYFVSCTPDILYEKETRDVVKTFPLELMMAETDGPWPFEGMFVNQMTHPKMIHDVVREISIIKKEPLTEVYSTLYGNVKRLYRL